MSRKLLLHACRILGVLLLPVAWLAAKYGAGVEDRYLPAPESVFQAIFAIGQPPLPYHILATTVRIFVGLSSGFAAGLLSGIYMYKWRSLRFLSLPAIQSLRSVPPIATVPFFLIWFGFAEFGKFLLVLLAVGLNVSIATLQILDDIEEKYLIAFSSFDLSPTKLTYSFLLPKAVESLLPTVRFSLSLTFGVVIVSELLGSQVGLGYLIQTARTTYAIQTIFLATAILGVINWACDVGLRLGWRKLVFWKPQLLGTQ